ncbi:sigma-54 dependent transcriptional regulator [Thermoanaerobacterium thermosaccharolyticum]|uniref:sigma-54-dependent transcriptional regulator n=1 Tax=Thermoanaerobacterium thermosaccharolyticum TaxID=1517 RepID=UPI003D2B83DC
MRHILVADDEKNMRWALKKALFNDGYVIDEAENGAVALNKFESSIYDLIILDIKMPEVNGIDVLKTIREKDKDIPVIVITAYGEIDTAIQAIKLGAVDYIQKPFDINELKLTIGKALEITNLKEEVKFLREELNGKEFDIIGESSKLKDVLNIVKKVAPTDATVLLLGESGTGKELIAKAIHNLSKRKDGPYIKVNCAALPENLLESELFGYEKGAFTGALSRKPGRFERANGGTIFLDEIGEISPSIQVKMLRILQEREFERLGGIEILKADVRVIAATNKNLENMVKEGAFREDLFYRLNVVPIQLPPLRERVEDIPILIDYFLDKYSKNLRLEKFKIDKSAMKFLMEYSWPGNIRELENLVERMLILNHGSVIKKEDLPLGSNKMIKDVDKIVLPPNGISIDELEKNLIEQALERTGYNQTKAAKLLGLTRHTLIYRMEKYGIKERRDSD